MIFGAKKHHSAFFEKGTINFTSGSQQFSLESSLSLKGDHNILNTMAAMLAVSECGVPPEISIKLLEDFESLPHRLEYVGVAGGIEFYNDSISTVPESAIAAIKTIQNIDTIVLGGFDRGLDYSTLINYLRASSIRNVILLGKAGEAMLSLFEKVPSPRQKYFFVNGLDEAFGVIKKSTRPGYACLLSPAAASYDQFHNFEHRGDTFKSLVMRFK